MPVNAVVRGVELAPGIAFPERGVTGIERGMPVLVAGQQVGIFAITLGEILFAEAFIDRGIGQQSLSNETRAGIKILLFLPMDCDLCLVYFGLLLFFLHYANVSHVLNLSISES